MFENIFEKVSSIILKKLSWNKCYCLNRNDS